MAQRFSKLETTTTKKEVQKKKTYLPRYSKLETRALFQGFNFVIPSPY